MNVIFASSQNGRIESEDAHVHDCYEIIFMLEGCCFIYIDDEEFLMSENSVAVIPPGVVHGSLSAEGFRTLFIQVGGIEWNRPVGLDNLKVYDDENIIYTFHCYAPDEFTHQQGVLQAKPLYYNRKMLWPCDDIERYREN